MSTFLENQNWRYATKKFDALKKINDQDLGFLKQAIQLSTSSYGLQLYKVIDVQNPEIRSKLQAPSWGQSQIVDASHLFVFASFTHVNDQDIDTYLTNVAATRNIPVAALKGYGDFMKNSISAKSDADKIIWNEKQSYLALANLLNAAAELKIDVCPMEGFDAKQYNDILGLDAMGLTATVVATIGYRAQDDATQHNIKVRKSIENLFTNI